MLENENIKAAIFAVVFLVLFSYFGHHNKQCGTNVVVNTTAPTHETNKADLEEFGDYETLQQVSTRLHSSTAFLLAEAERIAGFNFKISGADRTAEENRKKGYAKYSAHITDENGVCHAVDIAFSSTKERDAIKEALKKAGFKRIGTYSAHIHADNKVNPKIYKQASWKGGKSK